MNIIIGLCHFCEAHGPKAIFCTFSTEDEKYAAEPAPSASSCTGCSSLGPDTCLFSKENGVVYCSRETMPNIEVAVFLRHAAMRSIACEITWKNDGGIVYFADHYGHVLTLTFQLKDTQARGLRRWFSVIVLMKDKTMILGLSPMLSQHMKTVRDLLQDATAKVFDSEQLVCSQRALRLNTGRNDFGPSRSLTALTGMKDIFQVLHSNFTWMIKAGAKVYTETLYDTTNLLSKLNIPGPVRSTQDTQNPNRFIGIRKLQKLMGRDVFRKILYCLLTGVKIIIKSDRNSPKLIPSLTRMMPFAGIVTNVRYAKEGEQIQTTDKVCVLEESNNKFKCNFNAPKKSPSLMIRMESAIDSSAISDKILPDHIKSVQVEWFGTIRVLNGAQAVAESPTPPTALKQALGLSQHDEALLNYWKELYCT